MRLGIAIVALVAILTGTVAASAIVTFRSADRVVLAADSRRLRADGHQDAVCKISQAGPWWFVMGGLAGSNLYDFRELTAHAIAGAQRLADVQAALTATVLPEVRRLVSAALTADQSARFVAADGGPVFSATIAGLEKGVPTAAAFVAFVQREPFDVSAAWLTCPGPESQWCTPEGRVFYGATVAAEGPLLRQILDRPAWMQEGDGAAARRLIQEQIDATPEEVAGPIDVLELTASGARWVDPDPTSSCVSANTPPATPKASPVLTEEQRLRLTVLAQDVEIAELRLRLADGDRDAARRQFVDVMEGLSVDGFDLNLTTLEYEKRGPAENTGPAGDPTSGPGPRTSQRP